MFVCPNCRIEYEEDKKFCKKCGMALGFRAAKKNCPDCRIEYEPERNFCKKCGRPLDPGPLPSAATGAVATDRPSPGAPEKRDVSGAGEDIAKDGSPLTDQAAGLLSADMKGAESAASGARILAPPNQAIDNVLQKAPSKASAAPLSPPRPRPWYAVLVPIMMGLYAVGLLVSSIMVFTVDGMLYFYDDDVRMGWAALIGCIVSSITGIALWRKKPAAGVFVAAVILLLGLVPFLIGLFSFLNNL